MTRYWKFLALLPLAACGPRDRCVAPPAPALLSVKNLTLDQKADILGVPPGRVPAAPKSASSFGALMTGAAENDDAQASYERYVDSHNDQTRRAACLDTEAYKARSYKDDMGALSHAILATCKSTDEAAALAAVLKYRNCALGK